MRKKKWPVLLAGALLVGLLLAAAVLAPWKEGGTEEGVPVVAEAEPKADAPEPAEAPLTGGGTLKPGDWTLAAAQRETLLAYMDAYYTAIGSFSAEDGAGLFTDDGVQQYEAAVWRSIIVVRQSAVEDLRLSSYSYVLQVQEVTDYDGLVEIRLTENNTQQFRGLSVLSEQFGVEHTFWLARMGERWLVAEHEADSGGFYDFVYDEQTGLDARLSQMLANAALRQTELGKAGQEQTADHAYDRQAARAYMLRWVGQRNSQWGDYSDSGGNCMNFASQVLTAGGIPMEPGWYWEDGDYTMPWVNVGSFTDWVEGGPETLVCSGDEPYYSGQVGDLLLVGAENARDHATEISGLVQDEQGRTVDYLVCCNTADLKNFPAGAYYYTQQRLFRIYGWNE